MKIITYKRELIFVALAAIVFGFLYWRYRVPATLQLDQMEIQLATGQSSTLANERNGAEVVHFYASWCGPCLREIRVIAAEHERLKAMGLDFVFITDDDQDKIEQMKLLLPEDIRILQIKSLKDIGVYTIPATYVINSSNQVVFEKIDACNWSDAVFLQQISTLLQQ